MTYISLDRFATALGMTEDKHTDSHEFASVVRINEDGSYGVRFNGATEVTRAVKCCDAEVGDRVQCVISNGQVSATCRVGGGGGLRIDLLWTNPNPKSNFAAQTLSGIPWQNYRFLIIDHYTANVDQIAEHYETSVVTTANPTVWSWITCMREVPFGRGVKFPANNQVQFGSQTYFQTYNNTSATLYDNWPFIVPAHIWGVR